jgi:LasA protease
VRAIARGVVTHARAAGVAVDMDGDRFEGTGWVIVYGHLSAVGRVATGKRVKAGDILGYASCDGGEATIARVSVARKYNGEWVPVNFALAPMMLDGWTPVPGRAPGEGYLIHSGLSARQAVVAKSPERNGVASVSPAP